MSVDLGGGLSVSGGGSGGSGSGGGKALPAIDGFTLLCWDFQKLVSGIDPVIGAAPASPFISTGSATDALSAGFTNNSGGAIVMPGPGGKGLVYAADFYADGSGNVGGLATAAAPSHTADNTSMTLECYFLLKSLTTSAQGVLFSKAYNPVLWASPFNALEINLKAGNAGYIEFGFVDSSNLTTEIGTDLSDNPRNALLIGYHHVGLVVDQPAKLLRLYVDGYARKTFPFTTGLANGLGPWMVAGNTPNASDSSNVRLSRCSVASVARSAAYMAKAAEGWLAE